MQLRGQRRRLTSAARGLVVGLAGIGVALVVTAYFLLDGRRTFHWLVSIRTCSLSRASARDSGRQIIEAYIRGNIITSLLAAPALLLGLTVSPTVALGPTLFYVACSMVERTITSNPKVYGREMKLSALAAITAFLLGGTLGGLMGALIALPAAAAYPAVERIWFDRPGTTDSADEHRRIQTQPEH